MASQVKPQVVQTNGATGSKERNRIFENAIRSIKLFAENPDFQQASDTFDDIDDQKEEIKLMTQEISNLREDLKAQKEKKKTTVEEIMLINKDLESELNQSNEKYQSLEKLLKEKGESLAKSSQQVETIQRSMMALSSDLSKKKASVEQSARDITVLEESLKEKDNMIDGLKSAGTKCRDMLASEKKRSDGLEKDRASLHQALKQSEVRLQKLESFALTHTETDEDSMVDSFSELWDFAAVELYTVLKQDLGGEALNNRESWENLRQKALTVGDNPVPLPLSNSTAAKGMRLAIILSVLSREIDKNIFQPNYLIPDERLDFKKILSHLATTEKEKESFCRSMLLSINLESQQRSLQKRVQSVIQNVSFYITGLLSEYQTRNFLERIRSICQKAIDVWLPIQRAQAKYESDFVPREWDDEEWCLFEFPGDNDKLKQSEIDTKASDDVLLTIFPRISLVVGNTRHPLTTVIQLRKSQNLCLSAVGELNPPSTSPTTGQVSSSRGRRKSIVPNGNGNGDANGNGNRPNGKSFLGRS
ncbi:hypothetical protein N7533_013414 [Penicillium manginii]|uniref:uncharacterized protein n=1 Tax=Penicillium manginii TaxID=203109 RepID=UPI00254901DC|nr:uncharacterized protein N7533_013414 [Penicillium manginii]KAJ5732967.1 hypothetical protein N7533_013414 [Penicillium manginii]